MSTLPGNPHAIPGPQVCDAGTINEEFVANEGLSDTTALLSELTRNTEATLAVAHELRTANLIALWASEPGVKPEHAAVIATRLGLGGEGQ
jgi:hypothetical protein